MSCGECSDTGTIVAPHPRCVVGGRLVNFKFRNGGQCGYIATIAILCEYCDTGRKAIDAQAREKQRAEDKSDPRNKTLYTSSEYFDRLNGHDGVTTLRDHERKVAAECRRQMPRTQAEQNLFDGILNRLRVDHGED